MDSIVLFYDKYAGKCVKGKVTYYENWYEEWKLGIGNGEIISIEFEDGDTPVFLSKEDIKSVYDQADEKFKEKMGVSYEEFCDAGKPSYKQVMEYQTEQEERRKEEKIYQTKAEGILTCYDKEGKKMWDFPVVEAKIK